MIEISPQVRSRSEVTAPAKFLHFSDLRRYGVLHSRRNIDRLERKGLFPRRVAISSYRVAWVESEIISHVKTMMAQRSHTHGALGSAGKVQRRSKKSP
jgi:predicted DNA-binding transcriptional regulator AlpA